jgi:predicted esterase
MKIKFASTFVIILLFKVLVFGQSQSNSLSGNHLSSITKQDTVLELINYLTNLSQVSDNTFFAQHCNSILKVIQAKSSITSYEEQFIKKIFTTFTDTNVAWNARDYSSYLERKRPFIISWTSPTDGVVSLAWLLPPVNWNPELTYPLYVSLHGLSNPYQNPIEYMARYLSPELTLEKSFDDGYSIYPWARGNLWYEGISETDVWESISAVESLVKIDRSKKYLVGHSMGGYGAWVIGQKSPDTWAALGIYAGALWYGGSKYLSSEAAEKLKDVPVYIVCGTQDGLLSNNQTAYNLLHATGNTNIFFTTFPGGHESLLENWQNMFSWIKNFSNDVPSSLNNYINNLNFELYNNFPNPFNPETVISYQLPESDHVELKVYDILGYETLTLVNGEQYPGQHKIKLDGTNLTSGIYFYQIKTANFIETKKMLLIK